jgi:hypothetical protein
LGVVLKHGDLRFEREDEAGKEQRSMIWFGFFLQTQIAASGGATRKCWGRPERLLILFSKENIKKNQ